MCGAGGRIAIDAYWISLRAKFLSGVVSDLLCTLRLAVDLIHSILKSLLFHRLNWKNWSSFPVLFKCKQFFFSFLFCFLLPLFCC